MEEEFRALLLNTSAITSFTGTRINFGSHPQGDPLPAIVLNVISEIDDLHMQGADQFPEALVQVDCYAATYKAAKQVSRAVSAVLHGYRGGGFALVRQVGARDSREGGSNEAERPYRVSLDFTTRWRAQ